MAGYINVHSCRFMLGPLLQVPDAIKAMYHEPLPDSSYVSCLSDLLLTATEELKMLRRESQLQRDQMSEEISIQPSSTTSQEQDNVHSIVMNVVITLITSYVVDQTCYIVTSPTHC